MTKDELLASLGLADATLDASDDYATFETSKATQTQPASPYALKLDDWSVRRGREALAGEVLSKVLGGKDGAEEAAADCLAAAFEPCPELSEKCSDSVRGRYFESLLGSEEFHALHGDTALDPFASELAAGHFAQGLVNLQREEKRQPPQPGGKSGEGEGDFAGEMRALRAAGSALRQAAEEVDDLRDAQSALGMGGEGAGSPASVPLGEMRERFERLKRSGTLRAIMTLAGRYRRMAQAKQRQKTIHGRDDVVGVEQDADLGRLIPSEMVALVDEDYSWDALRRYLERGLLCREYRGVESKGKGPIVVIVDESGSMDGEPIQTAKAFALAMAWIARHQQRWICFVGFSGKCPCNVLTIAPAQWDAKQGELMDWLEHFYSGGSDRDVPLVELPETWPTIGAPVGRTDVIQITDAICHVPPAMAESFNAWKAATEARYYTIVLGSSSGEFGGLSKVSDRIWGVRNLSLAEESIQELMEL